MTTLKPEQIKKHIDSLPVLPVTVTKLMRVTNDPESSAQEVMETILSDQSLCLTILKVANSALLGRPQKVDSIKMAVTVLGFNEVLNIALAKAVISSFSNIDKQHKPFVDKFWAHSFVCAMAARIIAEDLRIAPEVAFIGGLIHDIGKLIMLETFKKGYAVENWMIKHSNQELLHDEFEAFLFTHDQVGGQLLRKWLFPTNLIAAVANHHRPSEAVEEKKLAHIIQLADLLSFYCCNQESLGEDDILTAISTSLPDAPTQWKKLGLPVKNDAICVWFNWLLDNHDQGSNLKEAFST
jgi:putative nucleotidyltransferase with HDIG domain